MPSFSKLPPVFVVRELLCAGIAASTLLAQAVYDVPANVILGSAAKAVGGWDIATSMIKAWVFGVIISVVWRPPALALQAPLRDLRNSAPWQMLCVQEPATGSGRALCR